MLDTENWAPVRGYEKYYRVSDTGADQAYELPAPLFHHAAFEREYV